METELQVKQAEVDLEKEQALQDQIISEIRGKHPKIKFPDVYRSPLWYGRSGKEPIQGYNALIGCIDDQKFVYANAVSDEYKIITHEESLYQLEKSLEKVSDSFGAPKIGAITLLKDGARMRARVTFPDHVKEISKGKAIEPRVDIWNSYDLSKMYGLAWGAVELVCANGMTAFRIKSSIAAKHRQCLDIETQTSSIVEGLNGFGDQITEWRTWPKIKVTPPKVEEIMEALPFGTKHNEKILALPQMGSGITLEKLLRGSGVDLWNFHSIVTQFLTHEVESEMVKVEKEKEVAKVFHSYASILRN